METIRKQQHEPTPSTPNMPLESEAQVLETQLHSKLNNNYTNHIPMHFWKSRVFFNLYINILYYFI